MKRQWAAQLAEQHRSPPVRGRGLKPLCGYKTKDLMRRPPCGGVD